VTEGPSKADLEIPPKLTDPLSDVTRQARVYLLGTSAIGVTIVFTGLIPTEISTFGIKFAEADRKSLLLICALVVGYFLASFIAYALSDYVEWQAARRDLASRERLSEVRTQRVEAENQLEMIRLANMDPSEAKRISPSATDQPLTEERVRYELDNIKRQEQVIAALSKAPFGLAEPIIILRFVFEFLVPPVVGVFAIVALLMRAL
jgi:hypothetical protein